jgi:DNA-binding NtrC family response regulator
MKKSVLIADRQPRCYLQIRRRLMANHYNVFHASSIQDAMEHLDLRAAVLLLVDLDVPEETIADDLSHLAQFNPRVRIIGVTERSEGSELALREHLDGVAEKPFALGNLITFIHGLLSNPSPWREFRYLAPRMPGLCVNTTHRSQRVLDLPPAYSGWGINE